MSRLIIRFCVPGCCCWWWKEIYIHQASLLLSVAYRSAILRRRKFIPIIHGHCVCMHAAFWRCVCVYEYIYAFRGPTMDQHARARCIFDDLSTITILGRRYLQHRALCRLLFWPHIYIYTKAHAKGQMRAYIYRRLLCVASAYNLWVLWRNSIKSISLTRGEILLLQNGCILASFVNVCGVQGWW